MITKSSIRTYVFASILLLILGSLAVIVLTQTSSLTAATQALRSANRTFATLAFICSLLCSLFAGLLYVTLSPRRLKVHDAVLVQLSGLFLNRTLPAGIGGLGLSAWYLRRMRYSIADAGMIISANSLVSLLTHAVLFVVILLVFPDVATQGMSTIKVAPVVSIGITIILLILLGAALANKSRLRQLVETLRKSFLHISHHLLSKPQRMIMALFAAALVTGCSVLSLWLCSKAINISISIVAVFIIYTFSVVLGTVTPSPGGLGGVEAAITAGFILHGVSGPAALAIALLYRFISYWLGLGVGLLSLLALKYRFS